MAKCIAQTQAGQKCKGWAVGDSERCRVHRDEKPRPGAPKGNQNAKTHGFYSQGQSPETIDDVYTGLAKKQALLEQYIEIHFHELTVDTLISLLALHAQNASRLARILRDRTRMGGSADGIEEAITQALAIADLVKASLK